MRQIATLDGSWRFRTGQDDGTFASASLDDGNWGLLRVPAHWHCEGYPYYAGEAWYRTRFAAPALAPDERCLLRFDAVDYVARVWLNGVYLGEHEGYCTPFSFDATPHLAANGENVLAVQVLNPAEGDRIVKGALLRWDCKDPQANPGGIWQSVHLLAASPTEVVAAHTHTSLVAGGLPILHLTTRVSHRREAVPALLRLALRPLNFAGQQYAFAKPVGLSGGEQELTFAFELPDAALWWPWDWGHPSLYELGLELVDDRDGSTLAALTRPCGLREVTRGDRWATYINGQRVFLRGADYLSDLYMSTMSAERYRQDIALARAANLNAFLPFGNVERPEFYQQCDEQGMLIVQYLSVQYSYQVDDSLVQRATRVMEETVAALDRHPAVIWWAMNGEPNQETHVRLDRPLAARCRTLDPRRIVQVSSFPIMSLRLANEDPAMHDWLAKFCHYSGVVARELGASGSHSLVAEFGHQSLPSVEALREIGVRQLWPPDWETIRAHNGWENELRQYESEKPPAQSIEELVEDSQRYQGEMIRYYIDHLRCHRQTRCNGLFLFHLVDCWPAVTWSVVDYRRRPKLSYSYLQEAYEPLALVPDCPPVFCLPGETLDVPLYAVNDTPQSATVQARATVLDGSERPLLERTYEVEVAPNCAQAVDTLRWTVPANADGETLTLTLSSTTREGRILARRPYRMLVRSSYAVPMTDPDLIRARFSWYRQQSGESTVSYEQEEGRSFARLRSGQTGSCWLMNIIPVHDVAPGDRLRVSVSARATDTPGPACDLVLGFEVTSPIEACHFGDPTCYGSAGPACHLRLQADGSWHQLEGRLLVPECPPGRESHLRCSCPEAQGATVDVTGFGLVRTDS